VSILRKFKGTLIVIAVLFVVDVFVLNQGIIATSFAGVAAVVGLVRMFWALIRRQPGLALERLARVGMFLVLMFVTMPVIGLLNELGNRNMKTVIRAVEAYKGKYGGYPDSLSQLVPEFLKRVPAAKPALMAASFTYLPQPGHHTIRYVTMPPSSFEYYDFERGRWGSYQIDREPPDFDYEEGATSYREQSRVKK